MSKTLERPTMAFRAYCLDCKMFHDIRTEPGTPLIREMESWEYKHRGHRIEMSSRDRQIPGDLDDSQYENIGQAPWWLNFKENTNFTFSFVAASALTFTTLNSLASDTNLLAGAASLAVDNGTSGVPLEIGISGYIKNHSSAPTVDKEIDVYAYPALNDTPTYPDTIAGTDSTAIITNAKFLNSALKLVVQLATIATSNLVNPFAPVALSSLFGVMPKYWGIWVVHNSGQIINASGNQISQKGIYMVG